MKKIIKKLIPSFLLSGYHLLIAFWGAFAYGFPSKKIRLIGVTGTNGKSTTVNLIVAILEEAGFETASLSSIKFKIGQEEKDNNLRMTMPGRATIQKFLHQAVKAGCDYAVLEVTSEGIKQHRQRFIDFKVALFTNLTAEHIESHGGFENYKKAKAKLFQAVHQTHIINQDDAQAGYFLQFGADKKYLYGLGGIKVDNQQWPVSGMVVGVKGISFEIKGVEFKINLLGGFNVYNVLAAISLGLAEGVDLKTCARALAKAKTLPGRMELVINEPFKVFVDYAFTPNALEQVYQALTSLQLITHSEQSKLICVLGACGGGRDKWKRPVLGKIADRHCQEIIVTNEDPYDEDPEEIIEQVAAGVGARARKILDRREAIKKALGLASQGDVVVITGKGSESSICLARGKQVPWSDREVVKEEFGKL